MSRKLRPMKLKPSTSMNKLFSSLVLLLALLLPVQGWAVEPTVAAYQNSTCTGTDTSETTPSISWSTGNFVVAVGVTEDLGFVMATPTVTGLTFSLVEEAGGVGGDTHAWVWTATAAGTSSGAVTAAVSGGTNAACLAVFVFSGSDGAGADAEIANSAAKTITLDTSGVNSHVIVVMGDWNAVNDTTVDATPTGTMRVSAFATNATFFIASFGDQASAGSTAYGITNHTGTVDMSGIAFEVLGTAGGGGPTPPPIGSLGLMGVGR